MNQSKLIILSLTSCLLFSCSKYEDGPVISLRTKKARLTGTWNVEKINGTAPAFGEQWEFEFENDGDYTETQIFMSGNLSTTSGEWEFKEDGEDLYLKHAEGADYYNINRLTMDELTLESFGYDSNIGTSGWIEYEFEKD